MLIGDEASFAILVNTQNVRKCAPKAHPPAFNFETSNSRVHLTIWVALCGNGLILGPYFFQRKSDPM